MTSGQRARHRRDRLRERGLPGGGHPMGRDVPPSRRGSCNILPVTPGARRWRRSKWALSAWRGGDGRGRDGDGFRHRASYFSRSAQPSGRSTAVAYARRLPWACRLEVVWRAPIGSASPPARFPTAGPCGPGRREPGCQFGSPWRPPESEAARSWTRMARFSEQVEAGVAIARRTIPS